MSLARFFTSMQRSYVLSVPEYYAIISNNFDYCIIQSKYFASSSPSKPVIIHFAFYESNL